VITIEVAFQCRSVLQCVAVCRIVLQHIAVKSLRDFDGGSNSDLQCVAVCCSVLQRVAVCC